MPPSFMASCIMYELDETSKAVAAFKAMLALPVLLNQEVLALVPASLIGISVKVLLLGVMTPLIKPPMIMAL